MLLATYFFSFIRETGGGYEVMPIFMGYFAHSIYILGIYI